MQFEKYFCRLIAVIFYMVTGTSVQSIQNNILFVMENSYGSGWGSLFYVWSTSKYRLLISFEIPKITDSSQMQKLIKVIIY